MNCRHCKTTLRVEMVDLGSAPPSNAYLSASMLMASEKTFPLKVMACDQCWLAQTIDFAQADELFAHDYAYFSGFSTSWLRHAEAYVAQMTARFGLHAQSHVVEVASNDGYLLQYVKARGIACTGIEPTASTAAAARAKGIDTIEAFFGAALGAKLTKEGKSADLMAANNVLAHVPDINDFLIGFANALKPHGVATFEFPHLMKLLEENQFDTIYHEHFSYLSLTALNRIFDFNGLSIFDVEQIPTHGGSLRIFSQRKNDGIHKIETSVASMLRQEADAGLATAETYSALQTAAEKVKDDFVSFLIEAKRSGKRVAAYGAAAKGNTLINFAGCRRDLIAYVVDRNPAKQSKYMPGSRIPIMPEDRLSVDRPDYIVILPWNLKAEISEQLGYARKWGAKFVVAVPKLDIF